MSTRYIQAAVTDEEHDMFSRFAGMHRITLSDLVGAAVKEYILTRKEEDAAKNGKCITDNQLKSNP
jgi:hypothetical protein